MGGKKGQGKGKAAKATAKAATGETGDRGDIRHQYDALEEAEKDARLKRREKAALLKSQREQVKLAAAQHADTHHPSLATDGEGKEVVVQGLEESMGDEHRRQIEEMQQSEARIAEHVKTTALQSTNNDYRDEMEVETDQLVEQSAIAAEKAELAATEEVVADSDDFEEEAVEEEAVEEEEEAVEEEVVFSDSTDSDDTDHDPSKQTPSTGKAKKRPRRPTKSSSRWSKSMENARCTVPGPSKDKSITSLCISHVAAHNCYQERNQMRHFNICAMALNDNLLSKMHTKIQNSRGKRVKVKFPQLSGDKLKKIIHDACDLFEAEFYSFKGSNLAEAIDASSDCQRNRELSIIVS